MTKLTDLKIRNLEAPPKGFKIYGDDTLSGFGVRVTAAGVKSFVWTFGPQRERKTIGRYPAITLQDARRTVIELKAELTLNRHRPKRLAFEDALALFITEKRGKNKARTIDENERILKKYCVSLHRKSLEDITTHDITRITDKLQSDARHRTACLLEPSNLPPLVCKAPLPGAQSDREPGRAARHQIPRPRAQRRRTEGCMESGRSDAKSIRWYNQATHSHRTAAK